MKQIPTFLNVVLAALLAFLVFSANIPAVSAQESLTTAAAPQPAPVCDPNRTVSVSGAATVNVVPDRVLIQLGVQSNGLTPDLVQAANSLAIQKVFRALQSQGIAAADISTDVYIIEPVYENYNSLTIKGYRIDNVVTVTLRDVEKTSNLVAAALKAGANQVLDVQFYTSELRKYRDQARDLAMKAAREKADDLARAAGAEAGCVLSINENSWSYYNGWWWYGRSSSSQNVWTQNIIQNVPSGGDSGGSLGEEPINPGQISIKAEIQASFSLSD
jgi:uncharacterized protein